MFLVGLNEFELAMGRLSASGKLSIDTETSGLRPYHGDRLFSIAISDGEESFYFNFQPYPGLADELILGDWHLDQIQKRLFDDTTKLWFVHNAKYDMAILSRSRLELKGTIHCTRALGRVVYNEHLSYSLEASAKRIGLEKDDTVEKYIAEAGLWDWQTIPGKAQRRKNKFFDRVPWELMAKYAAQDAHVTYRLGRYQEEAIQKISEEALAQNLPPVSRVADNERQLTKTLFSMEKLGVQIDRDFCLRAAQFELARAQAAAERFKEKTGRDFMASGKLFEEVFASDRERWQFTKKDNPSFDSDALKTFLNPAALDVLEYRDAKSKADFYYGFLYHADSSGAVHPNFNSDGTVHGRLSSSDPNFQNLTNEEDVSLETEFLVRRAIKPRDGFFLLSVDYKAMEYVDMLEKACHQVGRLTPLAKQVAAGKDVHQATADEASKGGVQISRAPAKMANFLTIYGGGDGKLAEGLKCTLTQAREIREEIQRAAPEISALIAAMQTAVRQSNSQYGGRYATNWLGRRCYFPDERFIYRTPNYMIAGGCADYMKWVMNQIHDFLADKKSRLILTIHDEIVAEVHESEIQEVPLKIKDIMENTYEAKYVPFKCSMSYSRKSLADLEDFPAV